MSAHIERGPIIVLMVPLQGSGILGYAKEVLAGFTGNLSFPTPSIPLTVLSQAVTGLDAAETAASGKDRVLVKARNGLRGKMVELLGHYRDYAQGIIETQADPTTAAAMAASARMALRKASKRTKPVLAVKFGGLSGDVLLLAKAIATSATYYWQWSLDGANWISVPDTMKARVLIQGLTPGKLYYFRFRGLRRKGAVDYCQPVTFMVA